MYEALRERLLTSSPPPEDLSDANERAMLAFAWHRIRKGGCIGSDLTSALVDLNDRLSKLEGKE